jgi:hypothetical protein
VDSTCKYFVEIIIIMYNDFSWYRTLLKVLLGSLLRYINLIFIIINCSFPITGCLTVVFRPESRNLSILKSRR